MLLSWKTAYIRLIFLKSMLFRILFFFEERKHILFCYGRTHIVKPTCVPKRSFAKRLPAMDDSIGNFCVRPPGDRRLKRTQTVFSEDLHQRSSRRLVASFFILFSFKKEKRTSFLLKRKIIFYMSKKYTFFKKTTIFLLTLRLYQ